MGPSSSNRIHNIHLMAEYIDGTLIRPGETFSFNGSVGPRTAERGFREGQMIIGSLLVPSIGGGVCQTATTLFNNAFELGLPILARQNHSFYISHYPMGRDAAVSWGGPDFAFRNDLKTGILITTSYTNDTLTFSFWGSDPKRRIVSSTGPQVNWRTPQTTYAYDPYAPSGSVRTVSGSNQSGFDVTVTQEDLRARQAAPQRLVHERVRRGRPHPDLRPGPLDPGPILRPAAHLNRQPDPTRAEDDGDDLFTPTLQGATRPSLPEGARPWRLGSQFYVAFFGGPVAAALIGWRNGKRLGLTDSRLRAIAGIGIGGLLVTLLFVATVSGTDTSIRLLVAGSGVVAYLATRELQKPADARYAVGRNRDAYDSLWTPGLITALACGFAHGLALAAVVA